MASKKPGRKPIPRADQEEIRRLTEVEGLQPVEIARRTGRDVRTVRKYVATIARDRAMHEASVQVYRSAMEAHHHDLGSMANAIKTTMSLPKQLCEPVKDPISQVSRERLFSGFEQHMDHSSLRGHLASWNNAAARWQTLAHTI